MMLSYVSSVVKATPVATISPEEVGTIVAASLGFSALVLLLCLATFVLWLVALISILSHDFKNPTDKIVWLLVSFFLPFLGSILYFIIGRKHIVTKKAKK
jgi:hypothetical protein